MGTIKHEGKEHMGNENNKKYWGVTICVTGLTRRETYGSMCKALLRDVIMKQAWIQ